MRAPRSMGAGHQATAGAPHLLPSSTARSRTKGAKLTASAEAVRPRRKSRPGTVVHISHWEQTLRNAKNEGKMVAFTMAVETRHTDEDAMIECSILGVDRDDIHVELVSGRRIWIKKQAIVDTEVLR